MNKLKMIQEITLEEATKIASYFNQEVLRIEKLLPEPKRKSPKGVKIVFWERQWNDITETRYLIILADGRIYHEYIDEHAAHEDYYDYVNTLPIADYLRRQGYTFIIKSIA